MGDKDFIQEQYEAEQRMGQNQPLGGYPQQGIPQQSYPQQGNFNVGVQIASGNPGLIDVDAVVADSFFVQGALEERSLVECSEELKETDVVFILFPRHGGHRVTADHDSLERVRDVQSGGVLGDVINVSSIRLEFVQS